MDEQLAGAIANSGAQLAVLAAKGTAATVANKFQAIRSKKDLEEVCNSYEEIINELVAERYEITDEDIEHLQQTIGNALDILNSFSPNSDVAALEQFKSLVSVNTLKAMQLLGFDYKKAIGDPLTEVCADAIRSKLGQNRNVQAKTSSKKR